MTAPSLIQNTTPEPGPSTSNLIICMCAPRMNTACQCHKTGQNGKEPITSPKQITKLDRFHLIMGCMKHLKTCHTFTGKDKDTRYSRCQDMVLLLKLPSVYEHTT
jgi:hypothetical protein